jgi:hypothetical protein
LGLSIGIMLAAAAAAAQTDSGPQGPLGSPVQNINGGYNITAPAQLPANYTRDSMAPTYPAADDKPSSRGGTVGDDPAKRQDMPDEHGYRRQQLLRERALPEPNAGTHTATPPGQEASPGVPAEVEPGSVQGGPQP